jgi:hypothetical protein
MAEGDHPGNPVDQRRPDVQPELTVAARLALRDELDRYFRVRG